MSPDGRRLVFATDGALRVFDAGTGETLAEARVGARPAQLVFLDDEVLGHVDREGRRTLFDLPTLRPRARWSAPGLAGDRTLVATPGGVLDVEDVRITRRNLNGEVLAEHAAVGPVATLGTSVVVTRPTITVYDADLAGGVPVPGFWASDPGISPIVELLTCLDGHLVRTSFMDGQLRARELADVPCARWSVHPLAGGWLMVASDRPILVRPDDQWFDLMLGVRDGRASLVAIQDGEVRGEGITVLRRRTHAVSEGMVPMPSSGPVEGLFDLR